MSECISGIHFIRLVLDEHAAVIRELSRRQVRIARDLPLFKNDRRRSDDPAVQQLKMPMPMPMPMPMAA
jgi:hypothetical protein